MPSEAKEGHEVYIAGALTGLSQEEADEYRGMYEDAAQICEELGFRAYLPHKHTDPIEHPLIIPQEVYRIDTERVRLARCVIAFTDVPSHGVGTELAIAAEYGKYVILVLRQGEPVSRMVLGNPAVIGVVSFPDWEKGAILLRKMIINRAEALKISPSITSLQKEHSGLLHIWLPINDNDGQPVPQEEFDTLHDLLSRRFGGWSFYPGHGGWHNEEGKEYREQHRHYQLFASDFSEKEFKLLQEAILKRFEQIEVLMTWTPAKRL